MLSFDFGLKKALFEHQKEVIDFFFCGRKLSM